MDQFCIFLLGIADGLVISLVIHHLVYGGG